MGMLQEVTVGKTVHIGFLNIMNVDIGRKRWFCSLESKVLVVTFLLRPAVVLHDPQPVQPELVVKKFVCQKKLDEEQDKVHKFTWTMNCV